MIKDYKHKDPTMHHSKKGIELLFQLIEFDSCIHNYKTSKYYLWLILTDIFYEGIRNKIWRL